MELKSGMTKPEEFDASIPLLAEFLVIWTDGEGGLEAGGMGWGMEPVLNLAGGSGEKALQGSA